MKCTTIATMKIPKSKVAGGGSTPPPKTMAAIRPAQTAAFQSGTVLAERNTMGLLMDDLRRNGPAAATLRGHLFLPASSNDLFRRGDEKGYAVITRRSGLPAARLAGCYGDCTRRPQQARSALLCAGRSGDAI